MEGLPNIKKRIIDKFENTSQDQKPDTDSVISKFQKNEEKKCQTSSK